MSVTFHRNVSKAQLPALMPSNLRHLAAGVDAPEPYAVALFRRNPVRIGHVKKAIGRIGPLDDEHLVLAGTDFTVEARELAMAQGAYLLERSHFGWTEDRYEEIHTKIATNKKRPVKPRGA